MLEWESLPVPDLPNIWRKSQEKVVSLSSTENSSAAGGSSDHHHLP